MAVKSAAYDSTDMWIVRTDGSSEVEVWAYSRCPVPACIWQAGRACGSLWEALISTLQVMKSPMHRAFFLRASFRVSDTALLALPSSLGTPSGLGLVGMCMCAIGCYVTWCNRQWTTIGCAITLHDMNSYHTVILDIVHVMWYDMRQRASAAFHCVTLHCMPFHHAVKHVLSWYAIPPWGMGVPNFPSSLYLLSPASLTWGASSLRATCQRSIDAVSLNEEGKYMMFSSFHVSIAVAFLLHHQGKWLMSSHLGQPHLWSYECSRRETPQKIVTQKLRSCFKIGSKEFISLAV